MKNLQIELNLHNKLNIYGHEQYDFVFKKKMFKNIFNYTVIIWCDTKLFQFSTFFLKQPKFYFNL